MQDVPMRQEHVVRGIQENPNMKGRMEVSKDFKIISAFKKLIVLFSFYFM